MSKVMQFGNLAVKMLDSGFVYVRAKQLPKLAAALTRLAQTKEE